jgi:hypothetical protein
MLATFISMPGNFVCLVAEIISAKLYVNSYVAMYVLVHAQAFLNDFIFNQESLIHIVVGSMRDTSCANVLLAKSSSYRAVMEATKSGAGDYLA